ncbi:MAG: CopG family transcriptional regulator [Acidobacteriota bacterium]
MVRTTVYLTEELKLALERVAQAQQRSEAQLIREGVRQVVEHYAPSPKVPLFDSGDPTLAERVDELLEGFGER